MLFLSGCTEERKNLKTANNMIKDQKKNLEHKDNVIEELQKNLEAQVEDNRTLREERKVQDASNKEEYELRLSALRKEYEDRIASIKESHQEEIARINTQLSEYRLELGFYQKDKITREEIERLKPKIKKTKEERFFIERIVYIVLLALMFGILMIIMSEYRSVRKSQCAIIETKVRNANSKTAIEE